MASDNGRAPTKVEGKPGRGKRGSTVATAPTKASTARAPSAGAIPTGAPKRQERRPELIEKRREERLRYQERHRRQRLITRASLALVAALVVAGLGWVGYDRYQQYLGDQKLDEVVAYSHPGGQHQDGPITTYDVSPPVGGVHNNAWQNCGYYAEPVANWHAVHSLEHGAVWITYQPDLAQDQVDDLRSLAEEQDFILVSPYAGQDAPVIATAWDHQLKLDGAGDPGLDAFLQEYRRSLTNPPEPQGTCSNGISTATGA